MLSTGLIDPRGYGTHLALDSAYTVPRPHARANENAHIWRGNLWTVERLDGDGGVDLLNNDLNTTTLLFEQKT